ncbi:TrmB family transcriptional regulator [Patescibacteria group bacterium]
MEKNENILESLQNIGLTDTEATIYLEGLMYPSVSARELEKQTAIKRTTVYHALNTLSAKGLVSRKGTEAKMRFMMSRPENIKRLIEKKMETLKDQSSELDSLIPLLATQKEDEANFHVAHYEGIEGIKLVVEEALYCKSDHWDIIAPSKNFFSEFDKKYAVYYIKARKQRGITARTLWELDVNRRALTPEEIKQRQPRVLPKVMHGKFKSVMILFDDKIALISSIKELSAVLITNQEMHDTLLAMFEGLWASSEEYKR